MEHRVFFYLVKYYFLSALLCRAEGEFRRRAMQAIDNNVKPFLFLQTANRWLGIRLVSLYFMCFPLIPTLG